MGGFFASLFEEMGARRKRLRKAIGDRGQALTEFLVLAGLGLGSLGLFVRDWMAAVTPWGFWLPLVFVVGYFAIDARRQASVRAYRAELPQLNSALDEQERVALLAGIRSDPDFGGEDVAEAEERFVAATEERHQGRYDNANATVARRYDWYVLAWSSVCALAGAAAFVIAMSSEPQPENWTPPDSAVSVDISP